MEPILEPSVTICQGLIVPVSQHKIVLMEKNIELNEFSHRLNALCEEKGMAYWGRQVALGKLFGVSQKGARKWLEAESWPRMETLIKIAAWADVSIDWLISGRGEKRKEVTPPAAPAITPEEQKLLDMYRNADNRGQNHIHHVAQIESRYGTPPNTPPVPENIAKNHAFSFGTGGKPYTLKKTPVIIKKKA